MMEFEVDVENLHEREWYKIFAEKGGRLLLERGSVPMENMIFNSNSNSDYN